MTLPKQFRKDNAQNIFIYHYVEELVANYGKYLEKIFDETDIKISEFPFLVRIRFADNTTQKELVDLFKVSDGYAAKLLRKFEVKGYITRAEDPTNRRRKIVKLTPQGIEKTDELIKIIENWERDITKKITADELKTLKEILIKLFI